MKSQFLTHSLFATSLLISTTNASDLNSTTVLDPVVVSADFREESLSKTVGGVSLIDENYLYDKASQPLEDVLSKAPNVNFSTGASRAHYIQIRGIGERSQFELPVNPSVGIIYDGINLSQSALGVSMFDVKQIEVLRGPQGTTFGANGLAGVINVISNEPTKEDSFHMEATAGNYNTFAFGGAAGGSIVKDKLLGRFSIYQNSSDGFIENSYLKKDDTNNIDELSAKIALKLLASQNHTIDLNYHHTDVDNGYDAFSFDNSRTTHSDDPGKDKQKTDAFSLKSTYQFSPKAHLVSLISHSDSDIEYSYDEDWSYKGEFSDDLWPYSYFDQYLRDRKQTDVDIRVVSDNGGEIFNGSTKWTVGFYYQDFNEDLNRHRRKEDKWVNFSSSYDSNSYATYGQLDTKLNPKLTLVTGLRVERWESDYSDSNDMIISNDETLNGGKIALKYQKDDNNLYYIALSKGYKPGGVNPDDSLIDAARSYDTESLYNLDLGLNSKYLDGKLLSKLNLFYGQRRDQQVKSSIALKDENNNPTFIDYIANAAKTHYYGLESEIDFYANDKLHLYSSLGLLQSEFDDYTDPNPDSLDVEGRSTAQSPKYQYNIGGDYLIDENLMIKSNIEGKGSYYFSNRHNAKASSYALINASLEYMKNGFGVSLWGRNLADRDYQTRGFGSFGNNPANGYKTETYTQQGDPRTYGITLSYDY